MIDTVLGELLMKAIELLGDIDDQHRLMAQVPEDLPIGPVRVIVLVPEEDEAGAEWPRGAAREWTEELTDSRQDIYTLDDGQPINAAIDSDLERQGWLKLSEESPQEGLGQ